MKLQRASQYMVFSTFEETVLLRFDLKVRTRISAQIWLFCSRDRSFEEGWELRHVDLRLTQASPPLQVLLCKSKHLLLSSQSSW